ncbi:hypothetical protein B0J13DRAFT_251505 [Dactylonectria estremocensis]|uniref:Uncharacterized protein n=1 Tax=Dactylonectria estremocensis TaxID=1079267 RepID=A0A9P9F1U3_9HYPO|nr:hypothetical protein B0J13DRAFT_251505 [Dactylonectria estremocensis]
MPPFLGRPEDHRRLLPRTGLSLALFRPLLRPLLGPLGMAVSPHSLLPHGSPSFPPLSPLLVATPTLLRWTLPMEAWIAGPVVGGCAGLLLLVGVTYLFRRNRAKRASREDAGGLYEKPQLHSDCVPRNPPEEAEDPVIYEMQGSIPQPAEMAGFPSLINTQCLEEKNYRHRYGLVSVSRSGKAIPIDKSIRHFLRSLSAR